MDAKVFWCARVLDMAKKRPHSGRRGDPVSLAPLKPDQALAALLRVKPSDVKKLEAQEKAKKKGKK
jgi:hypothetical protein